jgi:WhiB family redox-sensing transcriptional regulator
MTEVVLNTPAPTKPAAPTRWQETGTCADPGVDSELFFPGDEDGPQSMPARRLCAGCPLVQQCRSYAIGAGMAAGIWGGLSTTERDRLRRAAGRTARSTGGAR